MASTSGEMVRNARPLATTTWTPFSAARAKAAAFAGDSDLSSRRVV